MPIVQLRTGCASGYRRHALFTDGQWRPVALLVKARDCGWRVLVRWFDAEGSGTNEDWLIWDRYQFC
jgi:hypothetical protein